MAADDWIDRFMDETSGLSPDPFRLWAGISAIASVLERKVYMITDKGVLFPNLYALLSGGPGTGKTIMVNQVRELWKKVDGLHVGPDNPTKSSFLVSLMNSREGFMNGTGEMKTQSAIALGCREFGVMIPKNDIQFLSDLTDMFDNPPSYDAPRTSVDSYMVENPTVNILAGVTPMHLYETFPESAWGQGFTSRLIFVYSEGLPKQRGLFNKRKDISKSELAAPLAQWHKYLVGEFEWEIPAAEAAETYCREEGMPPAPDHERLRTYCERREVTLLKLSMISAVASNHGLTVTLSDFERAKRWLLETEALMPDTFRAMIQKSDSQLIRDLHVHCWNKYATLDKSKKIPLPEEILWEFLQERTTSERIPRILESAIKSGVFAKDLQQRYIPRTLDKFNLEGL